MIRYPTETMPSAKSAIVYKENCFYTDCKRVFQLSPRNVDRGKGVKKKNLWCKNTRQTRNTPLTDD